MFRIKIHILMSSYAFLLYEDVRLPIYSCTRCSSILGYHHTCWSKNLREPINGSPPKKIWCYNCMISTKKCKKCDNDYGSLSYGHSKKLWDEIDFAIDRL